MRACVVVVVEGGVEEHEITMRRANKNLLIVSTLLFCQGFFSLHSFFKWFKYSIQMCFCNLKSMLNPYF